MSAIPQVSVILPTWNRAHVLRRAIDSVLAQTFTDLELIVVDDGSIDDTSEVLASIADPRLRVLRPGGNHGAAAARNAGIEAARGHWLAFQDSDDEWLPGKLERQLAAAARDERIGLVLCGYEVDDAGRRLQVQPRDLLAGGDGRRDALDGWPIITPAWLVRRDLVQALGGFQSKYRVFEDWDLAFRLLDRCRAAAAAGPLLVKHGSRDTLCANPETLREGLTLLLAEHGERWRIDDRRLARRYAHLGCLQFFAGHRRWARRSLARATRLSPLSPAPLLLLASVVGRGVWRLQQWFPRFAQMAP